MADIYPNEPGSKGNDGTSQDAAAAISGNVSYLRRIALAALGNLGTGTSLEVVDATGLTRESIAPRLSELRRLGLVEATGERRCNPSGKKAAVLRLTVAGRQRFIQVQRRRARASGCDDPHAVGGNAA